MDERKGPRWVPFVYREFYDVPRMIVFRDLGHTYLLDGSLDETSDDYPSAYTVFELPNEFSSDLPSDWSDLPSRALRCLGLLPLTFLHLDETKRKKLDASAIDGMSGKR